MGILALALACFVRYFLTGFQSKNLQHSRYAHIAFFSMLMALADVLMWHFAVTEKASVAMVVAALSNSAGITFSVWLHDRLKGRRS